MRRAVLLLLVLALTACGGDGEPAAAPEGASAELDNVLQLRADFEADAGTTRLLVLLSPT